MGKRSSPSGAGAHFSALSMGPTAWGTSDAAPRKPGCIAVLDHISTAGSEGPLAQPCPLHPRIMT